MLKSFRNYLDTLKSLTYEGLKDCIDSEIVWDDGRTRRNPTSYELFATHEHLDFAKEDIFKFSGITLDLDAFEASAEKVEEIWGLARKHGFKLAGFRSFERPIEKEEIEITYNNACKMKKKAKVPLIIY